MTVDVSLTAPMAHQEKTRAAALMEYSKWERNNKKDGTHSVCSDVNIDDHSQIVFNQNATLFQVFPNSTKCNFLTDKDKKPSSEPSQLLTLIMGFKGEPTLGGL